VSPSGDAGLTTHVLDTALGRPAAGLRVDLSIVEADGRTVLLKTVTTNADGAATRRCSRPAR
jgi:5-hydroxyisourate hydrolase